MTTNTSSGASVTANSFISTFVVMSSLRLPFNAISNDGNTRVPTVAFISAFAGGRVTTRSLSANGGARCGFHLATIITYAQ